MLLQLYEPLLLCFDVFIGLLNVVSLKYVIKYPEFFLESMLNLVTPEVSLLKEDCVEGNPSYKIQNYRGDRVQFTLSPTYE